MPGKQPKPLPRSTGDSAARAGSSSGTEYTQYRKPPTSEELAEIHRAQQAAEDADLTANGAPLADSSGEEEDEEDPEAEEESEDTSTPSPSASMSFS